MGESVERHAIARPQETTRAVTSAGEISPTLSHPQSPQLRRRAFHLIVDSTFPVAGLYLPGTWMIWGLIGLSILAVWAEAARALLPRANELLMRVIPLFKPKERTGVTAATFFVLAATLAFVSFNREVAVLCLLFSAVGDPAASVVGSRSRSWRLNRKSPIGTRAFRAGGGAAAALFSIHPDVSLAWWVVAMGVMVAAIVELLPIPLDDNFTVPLSSGAVMAALALL